MSVGKNTLGLAAITIALGGCTTSLEVAKITPNSLPQREGIPYFLPFTQFDAEIRWVATCEDTKDRAGKTIKQLKTKLEMTASPTTLQDTTAGYVIDYEKLNSVFKTSSLKVEYYDDPWRLKSINVAAEDKSLEVAAKAVGIAGKYALGFTGSVRGAPPRPCSATLIAALKAVDDQKPILKAATAALANKTKLLKLQQAKVQKMGANADQPTLVQLGVLLGEVADAQIANDSAVATMNRLLGAVRITKKVKFPENSAQIIMDPGKPIKPSESKFRGWFDSSVDPGAVSSQLSEHYVVLRLTSENVGWFASKDPAKTAGADKEAGIRYRIPLPAILEACMGGSLDCTNFKLKSQSRVNVMHSNSMFFLPFKSKGGTNAKLSATFAKNGTITSAGYENTSAAAEQSVDLLGAVADEVLGFEAAKLTRQTELATKEAELLTKLKELEDLRKAQDAAEEAPTTDEAEELVEEAGVVDLRATITIQASGLAIESGT